MDKPVLGFVGLGRMGGPMSRRLTAAGYELVVTDTSDDAVSAVTSARGRSAASPKEVADATDIVLTSLPTPPIVKAVALGDDGIVHGGRATIMLDVSTTGRRRRARWRRAWPPRASSGWTAPSRAASRVRRRGRWR